MGEKNGMKEFVETVVEEAQVRGGDGLKAAREVVAEARQTVSEVDVSDKLNRILEFVEQAAAVLGTLTRKAAEEAAEEGAAAAKAVQAAAGAGVEAAGKAIGEAAEAGIEAASKAIGEAAEAGVEAAGEAIEVIESEYVKPARRYGRGIGHGLLIGAILALLYTPLSGKELRQKVSSFTTEMIELIQALRGSGSLEPM